MGSHPQNEDFPHFQNEDGQKIHVKYWEPDTEIRAIVMLIHGYGEHIQRYDKIAKMLTDLGMKVCGHDHIGHGRSEGIRIDVPKFQCFSRDGLQHLDMMKEKHPGLPVFVLSHSMGCVIHVFMANERPNDFDNLLLSPCFGLDPKAVTPLKLFAAKLASYIVPSKELPKVPSDTLSRDPAVCKDYDDDPLNNHRGIRLGFFLKFHSAMAEVLKVAPAVEWPFMMLHGDADALCDINKTRLFYERAKSKDKIFKEYEGYYHEMDKEPEEYAKVVLDDMRDWLKSRLEGGEPAVEEEKQPAAEGEDPIAGGEEPNINTEGAETTQPEEQVKVDGAGDVTEEGEENVKEVEADSEEVKDNAEGDRTNEEEEVTDEGKVDQEPLESCPTEDTREE